MGDHVLHLTAIGAGVHICRAAHRAGNAAGKFQAAERVVRRYVAQLLQRSAALRRERHAAVRQRHGIGNLAEKLAQLNHQPANASVPHKQVAAIAQHAHRHARLSGRRICSRELLHVGDLRQHIRRPSQLKGGIAAHGRVFHDLLFGNGALERFQQLFPRGRIHQTNLPVNFDAKIVSHFPGDVKGFRGLLYAARRRAMRRGAL